MDDGQLTGEAAPRGVDPLGAAGASGGSFFCQDEGVNGWFLHPGKKTSGGGARNARRGQSPPARAQARAPKNDAGASPRTLGPGTGASPRTLGPGTGASPRTLGPGTGVSPRLRATPKAAQPFEGALTPIPWPHSSRPWRALRFSRSQASRWAMAVIRCSTGSTSSCSRVTGWRWSGATDRENPP